MFSSGSLITHGFIYCEQRYPTNLKVNKFQPNSNSCLKQFSGFILLTLYVCLIWTFVKNDTRHILAEMLAVDAAKIRKKEF